VLARLTSAHKQRRSEARQRERRAEKPKDDFEFLLFPSATRCPAASLDVIPSILAVLCSVPVLELVAQAMS